MKKACEKGVSFDLFWLSLCSKRTLCKYLYLIAGGGSYGGHRRSGGYYEGGGGGGGGRRGYDDGGRRHEMSPPSKRMRGNDWYVGVLFLNLNYKGYYSSSEYDSTVI